MNTQTLTMLKRFQAAEMKRRKVRHSLESATRIVERFQRRLEDWNDRSKTTEDLLVEKQARLAAQLSEIATLEKASQR